MIKLDIEGMESNALRGGRSLIRRTKPVIYMEYDRPENHDATVSILNELGYEAWRHYVPMFSPDNYGRNTADAVRLATLTSANLICLPRGSDHPRPIGLEPFA